MEGTHTRFHAKVEACVAIGWERLYNTFIDLGKVSTLMLAESDDCPAVIN